MKANKILAVLMAAASLLVALVSCGGNVASSISATSQNTEAINVVDMKGREIHLPKPAERVVVISAADSEIIYALGAGESVVGRGEYCDWPEEVLTVPSVQSGNETNTEQIIALQPQVVFMSTMAQSEKQVSRLEEAGITVVVCEAVSVEDVYTAIGLIGACMGKAEQADVLIAQMKQDFAAVASAVPQDEKGKSVYFEVSPLEWGLWAAGSNTFMDEIGVMLGLKNAFSDVDGWAEISQEQVLERNPDYIVSVAMYSGEGTRPEDEIMARPSWQDITAVKNKDVFLLNSDEISRPGPRLVQAAQALLELLYGA